MDVKEAIEKRRSRRALEPPSLDKEYIIEELARAAMLAPSCYNNQPWRLVFVYEKDLLDEIAFSALPEGNRWIVKGGMIIALVSSPGWDCIANNIEYYLFDCGLATGQMMLRATEMGIVVHPVAGFDEKEAKRILKIPADLRVPALMAVGRPMDDVSKADFLSEKQIKAEAQRPARKPEQDVVFLNIYGSR